MAKTQSTFPTTIDNTLQVDRAAGDTITSESYDIIEDALFELETKVGVDSSAVTASIDYKISNYPTAGVKSRIVQVVNTLSGAVATGTTVIPNDDSIPQITEGDEYMTLAITPTNASNKLLIEVTIVLCNTYAGEHILTVALFKDTTADALAAVCQISSTSNDPVTFNFTHYMVTGTTSPITFRIRGGGNNAATTTFNGLLGGRYFGGVMASSITITEIAV